MRFVEYERRGAVAVIRMNRPERGNALGSEMATDLLEAHARFRDDDGARVAVLTGTGDFFCTGMDLKQAVETEDYHIDPRTIDIFEPEDLPKPIVSAINGWAVGAGMSLAIEVTELAIMSRDARMAMWEMRSGAPARWQYRVSHSLTPAEAATVSYGHVIDGELALRMGLVNRVVPSDSLMDAAMETAEYLAGLPPLAVAATKALLRKAAPRVPAELECYARNLIMPLVSSRHNVEGIQDFVERRTPDEREC
jgi:enoyl-CoA hydratase/carnithine racemase